MSCEHHHLHFSHRRHHISYDDHDLSMLLDPAYTRPRSSSSQTRVYKDTHGDIHDPDYRHFTSLSDTDLSYYPPSTTPPSSNNKLTKRLLSRSTHTQRSSFVEEHVHPYEVDNVWEDADEEAVASYEAFG